MGGQPIVMTYLTRTDVPLAGRGSSSLGSGQRPCLAMAVAGLRMPAARGNGQDRLPGQGVAG